MTINYDLVEKNMKAFFFFNWIVLQPFSMTIAMAVLITYSKAVDNFSKYFDT